MPVFDFFLTQIRYFIGNRWNWKSFEAACKNINLDREYFLHSRLFCKIRRKSIKFATNCRNELFSWLIFLSVQFFIYKNAIILPEIDKIRDYLPKYEFSPRMILLKCAFFFSHKYSIISPKFATNCRNELFSWLIFLSLQFFINKYATISPKIG